MNVHIEKTNRITTIIINRPEARNAIDAETAKNLRNAFRAFEEDNESDVAVLYGSGGCFCSGADLNSIYHSEVSRYLEEIGDGPLELSKIVFTKPVIAAIAGYAVAGGLELALLCDIRIVEKSAVLGAFNRRWGLPLCNGGTVRLPRIIGLGRAMDLILTGRPVHAEEALSIGLANRIVEDGHAREAAEKLAADLVTLPQATLRNDRLSAYQQFSMDMPQAIANEFQNAVSLLKNINASEGPQRFIEGKGRHGSFDD